MTSEQIRIHRSLHWLDLELRYGIGALPEEHVLFGSVVMFLHGYREEIGDLDVFVSCRVWNAWERKSGWDLQAPRAGDPPFLTSWTTPSVAAFYDWTQRDRWIDVAECFERAEIVNGWRCIPLDLVRDHKRNAGAELGFDGDRAKHLEDLRILDYVLS